MAKPSNNINADTQCNLPTQTVLEHSERLVRIEEKIDRILDAQNVLFDKAKENRTDIDETDKRITKLEDRFGIFIWILTTVCPALGGMAGWLAERLFK